MGKHIYGLRHKRKLESQFIILLLLSLTVRARVSSESHLVNSLPVRVPPRRSTSYNRNILQSVALRSARRFKRFLRYLL